MKTKEIPYLTTAQMIEVDRLMIDEYGIQLIQMMENAGRLLADLARSRFFDGDPEGKKVLVLAGSGGNGGGVMVCSRHLKNLGTDIQIILSKSPASFSGVIKTQADILSQLDIRFQSIEEHQEGYKPDLIIDGIIGYNLKGAPRGAAAKLINLAHDLKTPILSLDVPSGVNSTTGEVYQPAIKANATMTLALPKVGLKSAPKDQIGDLFLADIGIPPELYSLPSLNLKVGNLFRKEPIISLF